MTSERADQLESKHGKKSHFFRWQQKNHAIAYVFTLNLVSIQSLALETYWSKSWWLEFGVFKFPPRQLRQDANWTASEFPCFFFFFFFCACPVQVESEEFDSTQLSHENSYWSTANLLTKRGVARFKARRRPPAQIDKTVTSTVVPIIVCKHTLSILSQLSVYMQTGVF